ncbi:MAG TPA: hypothetical protein VK209_02085 [Candidatus Sulfotelmatobacter sp.]|nr:hypothetical protein [Candidatus Sulfotelmatobacter sp.]
MDSEKMKALVAFKEKLEKQLEALNAETAEVTSALDAVNSVLLEKGFKRGDMKDATQEPKTQTVQEEKKLEEVKTPVVPSQEAENVIPLRTVNDEPLAIIYVEGSELHVLPDENKRFNIKTPPFSQFLVERVLARMQERDNEMVRMGQLTPEKMFAYNIVLEGDFIKEILFKNVDEERLRELKSSIRWTFDKMYEKSRS